MFVGDLKLKIATSETQKLLVHSDLDLDAVQTLPIGNSSVVLTILWLSIV
jgi:hypothetical protein